MRKMLISFCLVAVITASNLTNIFAADEWRSKYRDITPIEGTVGFIIHLYDVQGPDGTFYAAGVADKDGNIVLPVEYFYIDAENFSDERRLIETAEHKIGFVDENFKIVIKPVYDMAWPFENGAAKVQKNNADGTSRVFYIDKNGNEVHDPTPDAEKDFEYYRVLAQQELNLFIFPRIGESDYAVYYPMTGNDVKQGIINVITREYSGSRKWDNIVSNKSGEIWAQIKNDAGSYNTYIIGTDGTEEFKFKSEYISAVWEQDFISFFVYEDVKQVDYAYSTELIDGSIIKSGLLNKSGSVIVAPTWETPVPLWSDDNEMCRDGYLTGMSGSKNYEYVKGIGTMGDGKWGCVTTVGVVVIEPVYDKIEYNGNDKFTVMKDGKAEIIDLNANASTAAETAKSSIAQPTSSPIYVNGRKVDFEAYLIDGSNHFKLRDVAYALSGTEKQFEVGFSAEQKVINLTTGKKYTATGEELQKGDGKAKEAHLNPSVIYLDGENVSLPAYTIGGYNFFKLRDLAVLLDFAVGYDDVKKSVSIDA